VRASTVPAMNEETRHEDLASRFKRLRGDDEVLYEQILHNPEAVFSVDNYAVLSGLVTVEPDGLRVRSDLHAWVRDHRVI
jgi:hypothetical protein